MASPHNQKSDYLKVFILLPSLIITALVLQSCLETPVFSEEAEIKFLEKDEKIFSETASTPEPIIENPQTPELLEHFPTIFNCRNHDIVRTQTAVVFIPCSEGAVVHIYHNPNSCDQCTGNGSFQPILSFGEDD